MDKTPAQLGFKMPAEWHEHEATWLSWPHDVDTFPNIKEVERTYISIIKSLYKDEKINLMHIAICTVLEPYGYYEFEGRDADGWPHFKTKEKLPFLKAGEQNNLMVKAVIEYFKKNDILV